MLQRIGLFILTNIAVIVLLNIIFLVLERFLGITLTGYEYYIVFAAIIGFSGSFISLFLSKWSAKRAYKMTFITSENIHSLDAKQRVVYDTVVKISEQNHITLPEIGIYESSDPNAFATGASKNSSLVAVSTGLLGHMNKDEIEGVVAHEMAHVLNGDMVTMTLIQGIVNTFVIFISRVLANIIAQFVRQEMSQIAYFLIVIVLEIIFGILASVIVMWFSRHREYKADAGSATYVGKEKMIAALRSLQKLKDMPSKDNSSFATMQISQPNKVGVIRRFFSSHPPLEDRITALENLVIR